MWSLWFYVWHNLADEQVQRTSVDCTWSLFEGFFPSLFLLSSVVNYRRSENRIWIITTCKKSHTSSVDIPFKLFCKTTLTHTYARNVTISSYISHGWKQNLKQIMWYQVADVHLIKSSDLLLKRPDTLIKKNKFSERTSNIINYFLRSFSVCSLSHLKHVNMTILLKDLSNIMIKFWIFFLPFLRLNLTMCTLVGFGRLLLL